MDRRLTRAAEVGPPLLLFAYTFTARVWGITRHFWMHYDQIRDWRVALGPFGEIPPLGPVTHLGGATIGPAFYWVLWGIRVTVGPWFEHLPHAGGIGQALLHSTADLLLFLGIRRRARSTPLALAVVLIVATAPYDLALSSTIWNPMMAVTFAKIATALLLLGWAERDLARAAATAAVAWAGLQSHFGGIFTAASVLTLLVAQPLAGRRWRTAAARALVVLVVVGALQVPWALYWMRQPPDRAGTPVGGSVTQVLAGRTPPRLATSATVLADVFWMTQAGRRARPRLGWILAPCALVVLVRWRRDLPLLAATIGTLAFVWLGFALWLGGYHQYYYLSAMPSAVLTVGLALTAIPPPPLSRAIAVLLLAGAIALQPSRLAEAAGIHRMPEYGALLRASRAIAARGQPMRRIDAPWVPATSSRTFLYEVLGGRLSPDSPWIAGVARDGEVRYERSDPASR